MRENRDGALTSQLVRDYQKELQSDAFSRIARNALTRTGINEIAMNRDVVAGMDFTFSHLTKTGEITNQESSGRCWLFAGLNTMRVKAMKKMNLANFELSQSYCFFWDKLEKANYFLENIIETRNEDVHSRLIMWLLLSPLSDGGQWDMFANLISRYGVVPKSVMPETFNSRNSGQMNYLLVLKLRENAMLLRQMHQKGASVKELRSRKQSMLSEIYRMLVTYMDEPPKQFDWQYRDKKDKFHREPKPMTPVEFYNKYVNMKLDERISLINCPTRDKPYHKMYTLQYLGNMVGGKIIRYLNVDIDTLKNTAVRMIRKGEPVWFGCDVGKMLYREGGIMHSRLFEYDKLLGTTFGMDKAQRVDCRESKMTHAMVFTGVNLVKNKPTKWKVENSWGEKGGEKGFYVMSDDWFDEYLYQVVVPKRYLSPRLRRILLEKPIVLKPWDPMGSLAIMY
ncbi:MAG: C1 family peptidase [Planctomycetota bacterium]|nr:C1 family peptidase [Planctomycetota bacterium]MDI6787880.1 C1 family peptidase [Planctomycetota bacterium]